MNKLTITGNLTDEPTLHYTPGGAAILTLTVAVNDRRFDRGRGQWVDRPAVFHRVVAFRGLAERRPSRQGQCRHGHRQARRRLLTPQDSGRKIYRTVLEAEDIAVSLRSPPRSPRSAANSTPTTAAATPRSPWRTRR